MISSSLKAAACVSGSYTPALDLYEVLSWSWRIRMYKDAAALNMHTEAWQYFCVLLLLLITFFYHLSKDRK